MSYHWIGSACLLKVNISNSSSVSSNYEQNDLTMFGIFHTPTNDTLVLFMALFHFYYWRYISDFCKQ